MKIKAVLFYAILFKMSFVAAESNEELALRARKAYEKGDYAGSIESYEKILGKGYESVVLYYNLGNAYFRNVNIPSAILFYEKALKLEPNHPDIRHNLLIANSRITDKVEFIPELFYKRWWKSILNSFSLDFAAAGLIVLLTLSLLCAAIFLSSRHIGIRKTAFWSGISLFILFFILIVAARQKEQLLKQHKEAIVFTPTVTVKSSPDDASANLFVIHEGLKVTLLDQIGEWQEIKIANGSIGWLRSGDIRKI